MVGFGGYPSVPPVLAAQRRGIATVLHEQNALIGRANRLLAARASRIASSFEGLAGAEAHVGKTRLTGNPVRAEIRALREAPYHAPQADGPCRMLVTGGSQGATVFSDVVPEAVSRLTEGLRSRLHVVQQARPEDKERVAKRYTDLGVTATVSSFFGDLPRHLAEAHLVVCRAGASTVAEITVAGRPAVLVPYPHAADDHQTANARALDITGAAWLQPQPEFQPDALATRMEALFTAPAELERAAARARAFGYPDAVARLADVVLETATLADPGAPTNPAARLPLPPLPAGPRRTATASSGDRWHERASLSIGTMHFVGIGGIGMSGIAEVLHDLGYSVQGSDIAENPNVRRLMNLGIKVHIGHAASNVDEAAIIVVSTAIKEDNPEIMAARERLIPIVHRAEMLGELMRLKWSIAVAGTHGKTTTTSLVSAMLDTAGLDPTVINGGIINAYGTNARIGAGEWMVVEADESDGSFNRLPATIAIVTNIDPEHLDFHGTFENLQRGLPRLRGQHSVLRLRGHVPRPPGGAAAHPPRLRPPDRHIRLFSPGRCAGDRCGDRAGRFGLHGDRHG